jgi:hypothetical protein
MDPSKNLEDRRGHMLPDDTDSWYSLFGMSHPPSERVGGAFEFYRPKADWPPFSKQPGDPLQQALGYDDLLKYDPAAVRPVVMTLRDAKRQPRKK